MAKLTLHVLPPSPNNVKVVLALKLKGLDFDTVEYRGFDGREAIVAATGQPLTPVLVDGDRKVYDSFGILRYLDANWPEPRLFSESRDDMRLIERFEDLARNGLAPAIGMMIGQAVSQKEDPAATATANRLLNQLAVRIEDALVGRPYLMGDRPNAADITLAPFVAPAVVDPASAPEKSLVRFIAERVRLSGRLAATHAWCERVMAIDRMPVGSGV